MKTIVMSVGGSIIVPDKVDVDFVSKFKKFILGFSNVRFVIVAGGGMVCRKHQEAAKELGVDKTVELDWIGIMATRFNAELVRAVFGDSAYERVVYDPTAKIKTDKKVIIGAGYEPGASTDIDAVLLAKTFEADTVMNLSNIDYAYDKDPNKFDDAKKIEKIGWVEFKKIVGDEWVSGENYPFDPTASKKAEELGLKVVILNGRRLDNLKKVIDGEEFEGTIIS